MGICPKHGGHCMPSLHHEENHWNYFCQSLQNRVTVLNWGWLFKSTSYESHWECKRLFIPTYYDRLFALSYRAKQILSWLHQNWQEYESLRYKGFFSIYIFIWCLMIWQIIDFHLTTIEIMMAPSQLRIKINKGFLKIPYENMFTCLPL